MLQLKYVFAYLLCSMLCTTICVCFMQRNCGCFLQAVVRVARMYPTHLMHQRSPQSVCISKCFVKASTLLYCNDISIQAENVYSHLVPFSFYVAFSSFMHPELWLCSSLENVDASSNQIADLCPEVIKCKTLRRLCLDRNILTSLSPQLSRLPLLSELSFSGNRLESLPEGDVVWWLGVTLYNKFVWLLYSALSCLVSQFLSNDIHTMWHEYHHKHLVYMTVY